MSEEFECAAEGAEEARLNLALTEVRMYVQGGNLPTALRERIVFRLPYTAAPLRAGTSARYCAMNVLGAVLFTKIKLYADALRAHALALSARLADAEEVHRMQIAAISTLAIMNTRESAAKNRIGRDNPYWTPALQDVYEAVDREITERERALAAEQTVARLTEERDGWKNAALGLGERLASVGPNGYYDFNPTVWLGWADSQVELLKREQRMTDKSQ